MNITMIERMLRLFAAPSALVLVSMLAMSMLHGEPGASTDLLSSLTSHLWEMLRWPLLATFAWGILWFFLNAWRLYRWESGEADGGCINCGGPMSHKDGRYGPYSKCLICGSKREGWH